MRSNRLVHIVHCHAEGEVGDVIVGGVAPPPGNSLWEQSRFIARDGSLRDFVLNEPRGGVFRHVNLLVPPKSGDADMGWIIMEPEDTPPMSGSNSMCVATVLVETGIIPMSEPETRVRLEAPGGLIEAVMECSEGKVRRVTITNVPSFVTALDVPVEVPGIGTIPVDIAYGGDSFAIADAASLGFSLQPDEAHDLAVTGMRIRNAADEQIGFQHPEIPDWAHISFCQLAAPIEEWNGVKIGRNAVVINPGKLDRSPTGTGCSARMAVLRSRGQLKEGERFRGVSVIDSIFDCHYLDTGSVGGLRAIQPILSGRAWVTGVSQLMLDPDDPWPGGYRLSDTWPKLM